MQSTEQSSLTLISDKLTGQLLSLEYDESPLKEHNNNIPGAKSYLERLSARLDICIQFSHCTSNSIRMENGYGYRSILFLNDDISLASSFEAADLSTDRGYLSNVCRNTLVKDMDWYKRAMELNRSLYIFINEDTDDLCLARKIENLHYAGPNQKNGIGVMVTRLERSQLETFFELSNITDHTQILLLNSLDEVLYYRSEEGINSTTPPAEELLQTLPNVPENGDLFYQGQQYLANTRQLSWNLKLIFLTPYADLSVQLSQFHTIYIAASILVLFCVACVVYFVISHDTKPIIALSRTMKELQDTRDVLPVSLAYSHNHDEIAQLYSSFDHMISRVNTLIEDIKKKGEDQKRAELKALQAQINPHFIYNAMDNVNWIALRRNQDEIADMVSTIASIMRYGISNPDDTVELKMELENIKNYFSLQRIRYKDRIHLSLDIPENCLLQQIPKFILQPLVENSILHGIADSQDTITITVSAKKEGNLLIIEETDDGKGSDSEKLNRYLNGEDSGLKIKGGFGIRNINERLRLKMKGFGSLSYYNLTNNQLVAQIRIIYPPSNET